MSDLVEKWNAFCEWQQRPYQVAQKSEEHHCCRTCGEEFQGNYCPRCGQSAKIGRYSFKAALLLFLDAWGMGNRGMFRTLRDLILRPGYMIRDYISGIDDFPHRRGEISITLIPPSRNVFSCLRSSKRSIKFSFSAISPYMNGTILHNFSAKILNYNLCYYNLDYIT